MIPLGRPRDAERRGAYLAFAPGAAPVVLPSDLPVWHGAVAARLRAPHAQQARFLDAPAKRKVVRAGRRGGKTVGMALLALRAFLAGRRVLYAVPTQEQIDRFWFEVKRALEPAIDAGHVYKNETRHIVEVPGTQTRIRAKTAWNADTLRGDYADLLILDEWQLMNEDAWEVVGAPMLLDTNGDAVFVYTPPSMRTAGMSKAHDPRHAPKLFVKAAADELGRWAAFHFTSHDNPHISEAALAEITQDMTPLMVRQEISAEDVEDVAGALWTRGLIEATRVVKAPELIRVVTAIDPSATAAGDEAGVLTAGVGWCNCTGTRALHAFVLSDDSVQGAPERWAGNAVAAYHTHGADTLVAESNNGGEMVAVTIGTITDAPPVKLIWASRDKHTRAQPVSMLHQQRKVHLVGAFPRLEDELCTWMPGMASPNRLDAFVWALTELLITGGSAAQLLDLYRQQAAGLAVATEAPADG